MAVALARTDHTNVLVLRNELNEHIRPGMLVWGVSKFSAEKKMKEQPSFYAFFIRRRSSRRLATVKKGNDGPVASKNIRFGRHLSLSSRLIRVLNSRERPFPRGG